MDPLLVIVILLLVLFGVGNVTLAAGNALYILLVIAVFLLIVKLARGERL